MCEYAREKEIEQHFVEKNTNSLHILEGTEKAQTRAREELKGD